MNPLYYLQHLRSQAATASGGNGGGASVSTWAGATGSHLPGASAPLLSALISWKLVAIVMTAYTLLGFLTKIGIIEAPSWWMVLGGSSVGLGVGNVVFRLHQLLHYHLWGLPGLAEEVGNSLGEWWSARASKPTSTCSSHASKRKNYFLGSPIMANLAQ